MAKHGIFVGTYRIDVIDRSTGDPIRLNKLPGSNHSFLSWAHDFLDCDTLHNQLSEDPSRHQLMDIRLDGKPRYTLEGRMQSGEAGISATLVTDRTAKRRTSRRQEDAELVPFYFQLHIPSDTRVGVLVLQRLGVRGSYSFWADSFNKAFSTAFPGLWYRLRPFITRQVLQKLENAPVRQVTFTKLAKPKMLEGIFAPGDADAVHVKTTFTAVRGKTLPTVIRGVGRFLKDALKRGETIKVPSEWQDLGTEVTITLDVDGRSRSLSLGVNRMVVPYEEVTKRIQLDADGVPEFEDIRREADILAADLREELAEE